MTRKNTIMTEGVFLKLLQNKQTHRVVKEANIYIAFFIFFIIEVPIETDGSSQNPGIVQSRIRGRLTHWDRHLNNDVDPR